MSTPSAVVAADGNAGARSPRFAWGITVAAFLCLSLWPIWSARFPPMQDYPQHLFHAQILSAHGDPGLDYDRYYEFRLRPVYAIFTLTTLLFARLVPIEIAGKLSLSLYPLLVAAVVMRIGRRSRSALAPWGALLFFPLAFNQQYFLGNINYFFSLPLLVLALLDFEDVLRGRMGTWPIARQAFWQGILFITHPLSFLVYVSMAIVGAVLARRQVERTWRKLAAALGIASLLFVASWIEMKAIPPSDVAVDQRMGMLPPMLTLDFFALMFGGMQSLGDASAATLALWGGVLAVVLASLWIGRSTPRTAPVPWSYWAFLVMSLGGTMLLPFQKGNFSYINVRIAAIAYFLLALLVAQVRFKGWLAAGLVGLLGLCMLDSIAKQARLSKEIEDVLPVALKIPPRSRILPLMFDRESPELDSVWFDAHVHDFNYYHIVGGGGFDPYLLKSPIHPVHYKAGQLRPAPDIFRPDRFDWRAHAADYQYFLVRGAPKGVPEYMAANADKIAQSETWMLFERRRR